jgi:hypothetical protein
VSFPYTYRDPNRIERDIVRSVSGLFVGQLDAPELEAFEVGVREGWTRRVYIGAAGFLGLAKVGSVDDYY